MDSFAKSAAPIYNVEIGNTVFNIILDDTYTNVINANLSPKNIHFHSKYELFILKNGKISLYLNENKILTYQKGAILVPPLLNHYSIRVGDIYRFLFSFSKKKTAKKLTNTYTYFYSVFNNDVVKEILFYNKNNYLDVIDSLLQNEKQDKFAFEKIQHLLSLFFLDLIPSNISITKNATSILAINYVSQIEYVLFNRFNENITIKQLATILNLSVRQTSRIIQVYFHKPFSTLITDKKMIVACQMLSESNAKINKIVDYLNFSSESYFFRLFKKYYGCTPLKYRKEHMTKHNKV